MEMSVMWKMLNEVKLNTNCSCIYSIIFTSIFEGRVDQNIKSLYLHSKDQYDLIINNTCSTPSEALSLVKEFMNSVELNKYQ